MGPEMGRIMVQGQPRQKSLQDPISTERKLDMVIHAYHPSNGTKHKIGGTWSRVAWEKSKTISPKELQQKRAGGMAQVVVYLPSKHKTLSSNTPILPK
jgi:hypothetical protein